MSGGYREGVIDEGPDHVTFEFYSPFIIAATPPNSSPWGIYDEGGRNGLVVFGNSKCEVSISLDQGATWTRGGPLNKEMDLTDHAKGYRQYWLRFHSAARDLVSSDLRIQTVCQANPAIFPRLADDETTVRFEATGEGVVSAGPTRAQAAAHVVSGAFGTPAVTLKLDSPRDESISTVYAAAHVGSGNPPDPKTKYQIEASLDDGTTWTPIVKDWTIPRRGDEPEDFWSQSFCYGDWDLPQAEKTSVLIRFHNDGRRNYLRAEAHLVYRTPSQDATRVTYSWRNSAGLQQAKHTFDKGAGPWTFKTGRNVQTRWVEMQPVAVQD